MVNNQEKYSSRKRSDLINFTLYLAIIIVLNVAGAYVFKRFDLTTEKRYTLNEKTVEFLESLDDKVYIKVYLEGEFTPAFTRLHDETREILDEFRAYSNKDFNYEFINIYDEKNKANLESIQRQLYNKGIVPTELRVKTESGDKSQVLFPGALVTYKGKETVWQIFRQQIGVAPEICVNNSVQGLEYELSNALRKLKRPIKPAVAILQGHGELDTLHTNDLYNALNEYYDVVYLNLDHRINALKPYSGLIIASPDSVFDEKDKFIIDQFVMNGGKVLWCVNGVKHDQDSLRLKGYTLGLSHTINLLDLVFTYGARVNHNLVLDMQCGAIPINRGFKGGAPDFQMYPWYYEPLVMPSTDHPIVKNLELIKFDFASTIDTMSTNGVKKTILLKSSRYSRAQGTPARISLAMVNMKPKEDQFDKPYQNLAVLLEGTFKSNYANRLTDTILKSQDIAFKESSRPNRMIVISDGEILRNDFQFNSMTALPLGYDKYMKQTFGNRTFILNCMNYLIEGADLLSLRAREVKLRLLDKKKIKNLETQWQLKNVAIPMLGITVLGIYLTWWRRKKYTASN